MALKSNFEDTNVLESPFVDEVANRGLFRPVARRGVFGGESKRERDAKNAAALAKVKALQPKAPAAPSPKRRREPSPFEKLEENRRKLREAQKG